MSNVVKSLGASPIYDMITPHASNTFGATRKISIRSDGNAVVQRPDGTVITIPNCITGEQFDLEIVRVDPSSGATIFGIW